MRNAFRHLGPFLVCFATAAAMMMPYASDRVVESTAGDLSVHVSGVIEARNALAEGQFPVRVAPHHTGGLGSPDSGSSFGSGGVRYPLFQFYGNFPYTAGGLLCVLTGVDAFTAWRLVQGAALTLGGFYAYRCGVSRTRRPRASLVAGVVFMTAPYMWADLHARYAFPELVSFNLLPLVTFHAQRAFAARRRPWASVLLGGAAWSLLALSHNVTFLYASAFLGLYFGSHAWPSRRFLERIARVGLGYGLGILLTAWYLAPQFHTVPLLKIRIEGEHPRPVGADVLTSLDVLLAPTLKTPAVSATERLGLQVGWPSLAVVGLALLALLWRRRDRATTLRLLIFFGLAFLLAWSPPPTAGGFDVWRMMPKVFAYVQSSYRILMFVALFAALLVPYALATSRRGGRDLPAWATPLVLAMVAAASVSYVPRHEWMTADTLARLEERPKLEGVQDYLIAPAEAARASASPPGANWAEPIHGAVPREGKLEGQWRGVIPAPAVPEGQAGVLTVEGTVEPGPPAEVPVSLRVALDDKPLGAPDLPPAGAFRAELPFGGPRPAAAVPIELSATRTAGDKAVPATVRLRNLRFTFPHDPASPAFIPAEAALVGTIRGERTTYIADLPRPALVQLPVLYYPRLLRVRVDGEDVAYGNVGRFLAVEVPGGRHKVKVEFAGVRWANAVSAVTWIAVLAGLAWLAVRRAGRAARRWRHAPRRAAPVGLAARGPGLRWWEPAVAAALLFGVIAAAPVADIVRRVRYVPIDAALEASRPSHERSPPIHAFDDDEATYWSVPGGDPPVTLAIAPRQPATVRRITLIARKSGLWEAWRHARVELHLGGRVVLQKDFPLATAETEGEQVIHLTPARADRIVLHFADPVTVTRDGAVRVDRGSVSPGYREIRVE